MKFILEFFGLTSITRVHETMERERALHQHVMELVARNLALEKTCSELRIDRDLHKRESSAHARTARDAKARLDVGASVNMTPNMQVGDFVNLNARKYTLNLGIKNGNVYRAIELQTLVANKTNKRKLDKLAKDINDACEVGFLAQSESLLRKETAPSNVTGFPNGGNKPKGFA